MCSIPSDTPADTAATKAGGLAWMLILVVAACDQITKLIMVHWLAGDPRGHEVIPGLLWFLVKHNPGVAFSLFADHPGILTMVTTAAVLVIGWWAWSVPRADSLMRMAFGLILGGAVGNLIDRHVRGYVVDFIDFKFPGFLGDWHARFFGSPHFATFNLADTAICVGMGFLVLAMLLHPEAEKSKTAEETKAES